jgi:CheY-like chemotaxis protein
MANTTATQREPSRWQLLLVDDDPTICAEVREYLERATISDPDDHPQVEVLVDFSEALGVLETHRIDLLILDVRLGSQEGTQEEEAGTAILAAVREKRFVPVVFYTALPNLVRHLATPFIQVVEKTEGLACLLEAVRRIFATRLPTVNRALVRYMEMVQRDYMWDFVAKHWQQFSSTPDGTQLAYLLARRLAISLSGPAIREFAQNLGDPAGTSPIEGRVHPMQYYVMPPVEPAPMTGDLYQGQIGDRNGHWVLLTPSCDLATGREKAEWPLLAHCVPLAEQKEHLKWHARLPGPSSQASEDLRALLQNNRKNTQPDRFHFLPAALSLPDLVVDFQQVVTLPIKQMQTLERLASLDSPFAEALLARFVRYYGRLGTPDLDLDCVMERLQASVPQAATDQSE